MAKSLKIDNKNLEIKAKEKYYTIVVVRSIIFFFQTFHIYINIFIFLTVFENKP